MILSRPVTIHRTPEAKHDLESFTFSLEMSPNAVIENNGHRGRGKERGGGDEQYRREPKMAREVRQSEARSAATVTEPKDSVSDCLTKATVGFVVAKGFPTFSEWVSTSALRSSSISISKSLP
jgi:hypothetical protein